MPTVKSIVCLANSRKLNGRCIAGKEIRDGQAAGWVRPISAREHEEVSEYERQYEDGSDPRVLDVLEIPLIEPRRRTYQQENWLLDPTVYWSKTGRIKWGDLNVYRDPTRPLWLNNHHTTNGLNDKIPLEHTDGIRSSLTLIHVERLALAVFKPGEAFGNLKRRVQGHFRHCGSEYQLWVTDPDCERAYLAKNDGGYAIGECFLTISLGEPYNGACYKLIASIIPRKV